MARLQMKVHFKIFVQLVKYLIPYLVWFIRYFSEGKSTAERGGEGKKWSSEE